MKKRHKWLTWLSKLLSKLSTVLRFVGAGFVWTKKQVDWLQEEAERRSSDDPE